MMGALIGPGVGLAVGLIIGLALGVESHWKCGDCLCESENSHRTGYKTGFQEGVEAAVELVKERGTASVQAWDGREVWNIRKDELERVREDLAEAAYV